ncbi:MAG: glycosyl hydrolase family 18 protein [Cellulosilyticaceae bacterium]
MLKKIVLLIIGFIVLGAVGLGIIGNTSETQEVDPLTYFDEFKSDQQNMVYEDTRVDWVKPIIEENDRIYIDSEWAAQNVNERVYYDAEENILTITNVEEVIRINVGTNQVTVNNKASDRQIPYIQQGDKLYVGEDYLEEVYGFEVTKGADGRLMIASNLHTEKQTGVIKAKKAVIRTRPDKKAVITDKMEKGHQVVIYSGENGYLRVRNENGIVGYMKEKDVEIAGKTPLKEDKQFTAKPIAKPLDDKVKLAWDQMTVRTPGNWNSGKYTKMQGANVIAPTWFEFADAEGNLIDRGHPDYVVSAKQRGLQVWALMSHNFTQPQYTREILTSTKKRQHVIDQLVDFVQKYGLDGINIDIENIQADFGREWVQFMRELYPQMQAIGATVSVDVYMPSAWSKHYQRDKIGEVVDYFIVMAYDQHWSGSEQAGPTSGLRWVEEGITLNLKEVPSEKLVLGIPFFTRIWEETADGLKSTPHGMVSAQKKVASWGVTPVYDDEHKQYYAQVTEGDTVYKVWLEDKESIAERVRMIEAHNLAGYAVWKLGLEDATVWETLQQVK